MTDHRAQALRRITACGGDGEAEAELLALELRAGLELRQGDGEQACSRKVRDAACGLVCMAIIPSFVGLRWWERGSVSSLHDSWLRAMARWPSWTADCAEVTEPWGKHDR